MRIQQVPSRLIASRIRLNGIELLCPAASALVANAERGEPRAGQPFHIPGRSIAPPSRQSLDQGSKAGSQMVTTRVMTFLLSLARWRTALTARVRTPGCPCSCGSTHNRWDHRDGQEVCDETVAVRPTRLALSAIRAAENVATSTKGIWTRPSGSSSPPATGCSPAHEPTPDAWQRSKACHLVSIFATLARRIGRESCGGPDPAPRPQAQQTTTRRNAKCESWSWSRPTSRARPG
jgi:hypothetical protein